MDRRTSIKWVLAAAAAWRHAQAQGNPATGTSPPTDPTGVPSPTAVSGYGTDPDLLATRHPGELWPLTLTQAQRRLVAVLADVIIPADERSPSASAVGVVDFIDEWVSAPYPDSQRDRPLVLEGLAWLDEESTRRFGSEFATLEPSQQQAICDDICDVVRAAPEYRRGVRFFARFRDLTAGGFYSTPAGRTDLGYIGNVPLTRFEGPSPALLSKLGLP
jgi:hypothetical protein